MGKRLSSSEIKAMMKEVRGWRIRKGKLHREFRFKDFDHAIDFIERLRPIADRLEHHPELYNVYDKVTIDLTTHDSGGLTDLDFEFAERVDRIVKD